MNIPSSGSLSFVAAVALLALPGLAQRAAQMPASHASAAPAAVHSAPPAVHSAPAPAAISRPAPSFQQMAPPVQPSSVRTQGMPAVPRSQAAPFVPTTVRTAPHSVDSSAGGGRVRANPVGPANTGNPVNPVSGDPMPAAPRYVPGSQVPGSQVPSSGVRTLDNGRSVDAESPRQLGTTHADGASVPGWNSTRGGVRVVDKTPVRDDGRVSTSPRDLSAHDLYER